MGAPEILIALWLLWHGASGILHMVKDRSITPGAATLGVFIVLGFHALVISLLHWGGFW